MVRQLRHNRSTGGTYTRQPDTYQGGDSGDDGFTQISQGGKGLFTSTKCPVAAQVDS